MSTADPSRLDELQADAALWGLDDAEEQELAEALRQAGVERDDSWERGAAVMTVALQADVPGGPSEALLQRLRQSAPIGVAEPGVANPSPSLATPSLSTPSLAPGTAAPRQWWQPNTLLAAALLLLSAVIWWTGDASDGATAIAPTELRKELLQVGDAVSWNWSGGAPQGDVVWHAPSQRGTMRFRGLPANDPSKRQYQLWIVDGKRNAAHPVDGGVFDVPAGQAEIVIPIDPKIFVHDAQAFVVTVETAGGVVVSDRKEIVVLAKPQ